MVMQWTVNPPPSGTTGSIPVISTKFRLVHIMVIIADCLSVDGSSILPRVASFRIGSAIHNAKLFGCLSDKTILLFSIP